MGTFYCSFFSCAFFLGFQDNTRAAAKLQGQSQSFHSHSVFSGHPNRLLHSDTVRMNLSWLSSTDCLSQEIMALCHFKNKFICSDPSWSEAFCPQDFLLSSLIWIGEEIYFNFFSILPALHAVSQTSQAGKGDLFSNITEDGSGI